MIIFSVMIKVLVFALCLGVGLAVIVFIPLAIYITPYCFWVGCQNNIGKQKDKKGESASKMIRHATILYKAKLTGREPIF